MTIGPNGETAGYPPCVVCKEPVDFTVLHVTWQIRTGFQTRRDTFQVNSADVVAIMHAHCAEGPGVVLRALVEDVWQTSI